MKLGKNQLPQLIQSNGYTIEKQLGSGAFAQVYLAKERKTNKNYALKCINKYKFIGKQRDPKVKQFKISLLNSEVQNMKKCSDSDYIMKCFGVLEDENFKILILEYCNNGSLFDLINQRGNLEQQQAIDILQQLIYGFAKLHKNKIIHRDLKTQNILIHNKTFKIADLGMSKQVGNLTQFNRGTIVGTRCTMAPQVLKGQGYTSQADIWSLGVIFYQIITGYLPFVNNITSIQIKKTIQNIQTLKISNESKDFLKSLFVIDPSKRLSWFQLYKMYNSKVGVFKGRPGSYMPRISIDTNIYQQKNQNIVLQNKFQNKDQFKKIGSKTGVIQINQKQHINMSMNQIPIINYTQIITKNKKSLTLSSVQLTNQQYKKDVNLLKQNTLISTMIQQYVIKPLKNFMKQNKSLRLQLQQLIFLILISLKMLQQQQNSQKYFDYGIGSNPGKYSKTKSFSSDVQKYISETIKLYKQIQSVYKTISNHELQSKFQQGIYLDNKKLFADIKRVSFDFFMNLKKYQQYQEWVKFEGNTIQSLINVFIELIYSNRKCQLSQRMKKIIYS